MIRPLSFHHALIRRGLALMLITGVLLAPGAPLLAQDDEDDATDADDVTEVIETAPATFGSAPHNVSISPDTVTLSGGGRITVDVSYADDDGDAYLFLWSLVDTNMLYVSLPAGYFDQAVQGTEIPVNFFCTGGDYFIEVELTVQDRAGNASEPASFTMICNGVLDADPADASASAPDSADDTAAPDTDAVQTTLDAATAIDTGSAPQVISVTPDLVLLSPDSRETVIVTYEDADGDAARFLWILEDTDAIEYDLPAGRVSQQSVGADVPIVFYCTTPDFFMDISLIVEDEAGNQSDPYPIRLECR